VEVVAGLVLEHQQTPAVVVAVPGVIERALRVSHLVEALLPRHHLPFFRVLVFR
jgi:alpha-beta hydrolase superfamily lysophospholipase